MIQNNNYKGGTTMYKKLTLYFTLFLICLTSVFAANTLTLHFEDENGDDVDNVEVSVYECDDSSCSAIDTSRVDYDDTASTNDADLSIPATSSQTWFVAYAFAEESDSYIPTAYTFAFDGNNAAGERTIVLEKVDICRSTIQSFSVTNSVAPNEPIYVDVAVALEADTYSAFQYSDTDVYLYSAPSDSDHNTRYGDWYKAETDVELRITKRVGDAYVPVNTQTQSLNILAEESENVQFSYTPTSEGIYRATVTTTVPDAQCETTEEQSSGEQFTVFQEEDTSYCYTTIDDLAIQEISDGTVTQLYTGETYTVVFNKLSNSVDTDGNLAPLETALDITIFDQDRNLEYSDSVVSGSNADTSSEEYSFSWTPQSEGDNTIAVRGIAENCPYTRNAPERENLVIYVAGEDIETEEYPPVADAGDFLGLPYFSNDYDVTFDGSDSYDTNPDGSGYIVSYEWDFGDGNTGTGVNPTHTYSASGFYTATLTVTDNDGLTDDDTTGVWITVLEIDFPEIPEPSFDLDPNADCSGPYSATLGDSITFDGTGSEFDGGTVTFAWDFGDGSTSTEEDPSYTYSAEGTYTVTLTVTDDEGDTDTCTTTATITALTVNEAPEVDCSVLPTSGTVNEELTFTVDATDSDGTIAQYGWDFGDGTTDSTTTDSTLYTYTRADTYTVTVQVTDDAGETAQCTQDITISEETAENEEPLADCSLIQTSAEVLEDITFDGTGSSDSDGTIANYEWDFGYLDPSGNSMGVSGPTLSTTHFGYGDAETYTVTFTVTDDDGATGSCTEDITISEAAEPAVMTVEIVADPTSGTAPLPVSFSATVSDGVEPYTYSWDFGDGSTSTDTAPVYTYTLDGTYTVTLTVTDADGQIATDTETITVAADLPAIAVASASPTSGEPTLWVQFSSGGSSGNEPLTYYWTFGDGERSTLANPGHYYDEEGTYTATLTVTDADGDSDSDSVTITVADDLENIASSHYYVDGIALSNDGRVQAGDDLELWVGAENIAGIDKSAVAFNAIIQELGIYETSGEFDLDAGEAEVKVLIITIPEDTEPGTYYVRVTISDDDVRRVIYRDIIVTE